MNKPCGPKPVFTRPHRGFTLAEILIAVALLSVIATFTIPKVLQNQRDSKYNAMAKEAAGMISEAYKRYRMVNTASELTTAGELMPYLNYVKVITDGTIDAYYGGTNRPCNIGARCLVLHNGGVLQVYQNNSFCGVNDHALLFYFDPDGKETDSTTNSPGKSVVFWLYFNGRILTYKNLIPGTQSKQAACSSFTPMPNSDPPWFSWN